MVECLDCLQEHTLKVYVLIWLGEEASVDSKVGGVRFFHKDFMEFFIDAAAHDDGVDRDGAGAIEPPDAVDELFIFIVGVGEGGEDEVGAILEGVSFAHRFESSDEHGVGFFLELIGLEAAFFGRSVAVEKGCGDFGFFKFLAQDAAELAEGRTDNDLFAARKALADNLEAGKEFWGPLCPRSAWPVASCECFSEGVGAWAERSKAEVGNLHSDLVAAMGWLGSFFLASEGRIFDVIFVDGELGFSWFDDDGFHSFCCYFYAAVCFSTADDNGGKGFPEAVNRADTIGPLCGVGDF